MNNVDYFCLTQLIIDDITFPNGLSKKNQLGGGVYAVAGLRIWSKNVGFVCKIGPDYEENYSKWYKDNNIDMATIAMPKKCVHSMINYFEDGEREEINFKDCGNFLEMMPYFSDIPDSYLNSKGMYFFSDVSENYWKSASEWLTKYNGVSCWEINTNVCDSKYQKEISECLKYVDLFSINISEGRRVTGEVDPLAVLKKLKEMNAKKIILRMGSNGALVSQDFDVYHIPAVMTDVIDVTGGGNSSTGGFVAAYAESNGDIVYAGCAAATASSFIINQWGVPENIDKLDDEKMKRFSTLKVEKI